MAVSELGMGFRPLIFMMFFNLAHQSLYLKGGDAMKSLLTQGIPYRERRRDEMDVIDERTLVYAALLVVCSTLAVFTGPLVAAITFVWVLALIEVAYWTGCWWVRRSQRQSCSELHA